MASPTHCALLAIFAVLPLLSAGETCVSPTVQSQVYTTSEATVSSETVIIIEFSLTCINKPRDLSIYAEFNGKTFPASKIEDSNKYQVSWSDDHKNIPAGKHEVRFFDEEAYSGLRKAQRSGDDTAQIKSLFTIAVDHVGASKGVWLQSEFVAALTASLVFYLAYSAKAKMS